MLKPSAGAPSGCFGAVGGVGGVAAASGLIIGVASFGLATGAGLCVFSCAEVLAVFCAGEEGFSSTEGFAGFTLALLLFFFRRIGSFQ